MSRAAKTKKAIIFGTTDFAEIAYVYLTEDSPYEIVAFTVHREYLTAGTLHGLPVVAFEEIAERFPPEAFEMFVAIGFSKMNAVRRAMYEAAKAAGYRLLTYVSSRASHVGHFTIGENTFVFENNVIQPFVTIGDNVVLWSGNHIGHHSSIGSHTFVASHVVVSGHVTIGASCFVGVNATFRDGVTIPDACLIGAGALILKDAVPRGVYKGARTDPAELTSDQLRG
jgi:sugar O-acyltransferase (sialic acid O-acetyltransferase NeuD family)